MFSNVLRSENKWQVFKDEVGNMWLIVTRSTFPGPLSKSPWWPCGSWDKGNTLNTVILGLCGVATVTSLTGFQLLGLFKVPLTYYHSHEKMLVYTCFSLSFYFFLKVSHPKAMPFAHRSSVIFISWLTQLWWLESLKFMEQASSLETQTGVNVVIFRQNFFSRKRQFLLFWPSTDWVRPTHIMKGKF